MAALCFGCHRSFWHVFIDFSLDFNTICYYHYARKPSDNLSHRFDKLKRTIPLGKRTFAHVRSLFANSAISVNILARFDPQFFKNLGFNVVPWPGGFPRFIGARYNGILLYVETIISSTCENTDIITSDKVSPAGSKRFWQFIKHRRQDVQGVAPLKHGGALVNEPVKKASILNEQFQSVFSTKMPSALKSICTKALGFDTPFSNFDNL